MQVAALQLLARLADAKHASLALLEHLPTVLPGLLIALSNPSGVVRDAALACLRPVTAAYQARAYGYRIMLVQACGSELLNLHGRIMTKQPIFLHE